jgi:hypothetical protein
MRDSRGERAKASKVAGAGEIDRRVRALAERAAAAHADSAVRVRHVEPWSMKQRPRTPPA